MRFTITRKTLVRRFQQLFIISAVIGAGSVVACSSEFRVHFVNELDTDMTIVTPTFGRYEGEVFRPSTISVTRGDTHIFSSGDNPFAEAEQIEIHLTLGTDSEWHFLITSKALEQTDRIVVFDEDFIRYLDANHDSTRPGAEDLLVISDGTVLNTNADSADR